MHTTLPTTHSRLRHLLQRCVLAAVALLMLRTWFVEGLIFPCRVASGSMAPTLLGPHYHVICEDCGHPFDCGTDSSTIRPQAACPNCGYAENDLVSLTELAGDRLLIHKSAFHFSVPGPWKVERLPRRWEVVAFRHPTQAAQIHTKRVVGLPGESIQIRDGDVYVDGRIQRKDLAQQRALAVLVHDANARARGPSAPTSYWQSRRNDSQWGSADGHFAHPATSDTADIDWLRFHEEPITDRCGYNQMLVRREEEIHTVTDLMLSLRVVRTFGQSGLLLVRLGDGCDDFEVRFDPSRRRWEVLRNRQAVPGAIGELPAIDDGLLLEVSLFDRQFLMAMNGRTVITRTYYPSPPEPHASNELRNGSLAIGSRALGVKLRDLRVYRDVYYTHPIGPNGRWGLDRPVKLSDDEYFVLGDNSPISGDSRTWPDGPSVDAKLLVGKPLLVHFPARRVKVWNWTFQVPDLSKIRYIR
ncbi:MAG TPA: S26 family signal peptidase [Thermoguttaceae bacterium]|nr:S26 family signal peptidase [Thermoguttaceae bacterium]